MSTRKIACVKWFNPKSGYGFVTDIDSNDDIFVHHSELKTSENIYRSLTTGEYVEFVLKVDDSGKTTATEVSGIGEGPLMCETVDKNMKEQKLKSRMLLQVHDELIFEVPEKELTKMKQLVKEGMENVVKLEVPLDVEMGVGVNWLDLK